MSRRKLQYFDRAVAVLALTVWLLVTAAGAWAPFHGWLHGGATPDDDHCAVVAFQEGKVATAVAAVLPVACLAILVLFRFVFSVPFVAPLPLPDVRGPPAGRLAIAAA